MSRLEALAGELYAAGLEAEERRAAALDELGELRRTFCLDRDSEDGLDYVCFEAAGHPGRHVRRWIPR